MAHPVDHYPLAEGASLVVADPPMPCTRCHTSRASFVNRYLSGRTLCVFCDAEVYPDDAPVPRKPAGSAERESTASRNGAA